MMDFLNVGCTPCDETCAQLGSENYESRARKECKIFAGQIKRYYPEPENGYLKTKSFLHDFGTYFEVVCVYDDTDETATNWAYDCENDAEGALFEWDTESLSFGVRNDSPETESDGYTHS